jgi:hypothetical protein
VTHTFPLQLLGSPLGSVPHQGILALQTFGQQQMPWCSGGRGLLHPGHCPILFVSCTCLMAPAGRVLFYLRVILGSPSCPESLTWMALQARHSMFTKISEVPAGKQPGGEIQGPDTLRAERGWREPHNQRV